MCVNIKWDLCEYKEWRVNQRQLTSVRCVLAASQAQHALKILLFSSEHEKKKDPPISHSCLKDCSIPWVSKDIPKMCTQTFLEALSLL